MIKLLTTILLLITLVTSCKTRKIVATQSNITVINSDNNIEEITIDVANAIKTPYYELAKTTTFIPLIADTAYKLVDIYKIYLLKDKIITLDKTLNTVYIFNKEGKFLYKVGKRGQNIGEYIRTDDFEANEDGSVIEILDGTSNKLLTYAEGKFIKERKISFRAKGFAYGNKNNMLFHRDIAPYESDFMYQAILLDSNLQPINKYIKITKTSDLVFSPINSIQRCGNNVAILPIYSPYIYTLNADVVSKKYFLDFGKNWATDQFIYSKHEFSTFQSKLDELSYVYFLNTVEGNDYIMISFTLKNTIYTAIYNKVSKQIRYISDFNSSYSTDFGFLGYQEGQFISVINNPQLLLNSIKEGKIKANESEIANLKNAIGDNNNHVLMLTDFNF